MSDSTRRAYRASAPANLLLLGEYAVLEEGGMGIAVAPDVRAAGTSHAGPRQIIGHLPGGSIRWPGDQGLLGRMADFLHDTLGADVAPASVSLDTHAFFDTAGRKRGYGSSAAVAVVLSTLWMLRAGTIPLAAASSRESAGESRAAVFRLAVAAHRAGQGGKGSGYDVACSSHGGILLFRGGARPTATSVELPWLPPMSLFQGREAVTTSGAVTRLAEWRRDHPGQWREFFRTSNELVDSFARATSWPDAEEILTEYRALTLTFGSKIGVSAEITPPPLPRGTTFKSVGAGNELGVAFICEKGQSTGPPEATGEGMTPVSIDREGVTWSGDAS